MRVGILELLTGGARRYSWLHRAYAYFLTRQYASIMPQAVSVWCRQMGHRTFYATYFGQQDPLSLLPEDLDAVFISTYTQASALAYALSRIFRRRGARTVIGGPHAKAFPDDCLRFFDVAVRECDRELIADLLRNPPVGEIVSSGRQLQDLPSVEERMPEIAASTFVRGRPYLATTVPLLASVGCPYSCNFCTDWNNPYALLPLDRLAADLQFISQHLPNAFIGFHDPNFAVKFDPVLSVMESVDRSTRNRYLIESSLAILRGPRLERLQQTGCYYVAPGVESWTAYSNKSGLGVRASGASKLDQVVEHFELIRRFLPGIQANMMFGLDVDEGDEPVELTKEFMARTPFVWPTVNIPIPFGGTPLYDQVLSEGRVLTEMPFGFYYAPYLVTTIKNYSPLAYYGKLIEMFEHMVSGGLLARRIRTTSGVIRVISVLRTLAMREYCAEFRRIHGLLKTDGKFRAFHEGRSKQLPEFYHARYEQGLGRYAELISREDRRPVLGALRAASVTA